MTKLAARCICAILILGVPMLSVGAAGAAHKGDVFPAGRRFAADQQRRGVTPFNLLGGRDAHQPENSRLEVDRAQGLIDHRSRFDSCRISHHEGDSR